MTVPHAPEQAFEGFTDLIHLWWPVADYGVLGGAAHVEFEDRVLTETSEQDEISIWAEILEWQPARLVRLSWHPGSGPTAASEVEVEFLPEGAERTVVRLTHSGWHNVPDGEAARTRYVHGWPAVLSKYSRFMGGIR
ncbi:hypothetical protein D477_017262 [Arthrobacter crystallopoietes BAB-32]|uniref:Activator of Hsp90 ATPase homologue 1/2-like C-terminal domain-containing protein n=1 Tax=Arthrobacter crystallopoietes BAB-32 TaxID=1246476 RepID=N1URD4_9MICC|nr:hypothetical protein D477_017262 [Arthrobacter crystallopoietes BAB-32]